MNKLAWFLAALALVLGTCREAGPAGSLNVYVWSEYLPREVIDVFRERTGVRVNVDTYDSNEALEAKLQTGVAGYDVVMPSDYMVKRLIAQNLIQPVDHGRIPNLANLDPKLLDQPFDPGNRYSIPYFWGTTGLGYNRRRIPEPVESWAILFDERYAGRILMLDDMRECFGVALRLLGRSINEREPEVLRQAADMLKQQKRLVRTYNSGDFHNVLAAGDVDLAHGFNGQLAEVAAAHPDRLAYVIPREGGTVWMDSLSFPTGARNLDNAYEFVNFLLDPEIGAQLVNTVHYAGANRAALPYIREEIRNNPAIYPPEEVLARCEFLEELGEVTPLLDRLWTEIKAY